jgi:hypothetical protein
MIEDVVRGWAPVYPHLRCQESGEAIAWLSRVLASASVCAWRGRTEASLSRNWRAPAAAW